MHDLSQHRITIIFEEQKIMFRIIAVWIHTTLPKILLILHQDSYVSWKIWKLKYWFLHHGRINKMLFYLHIKWFLGVKEVTSMKHQQKLIFWWLQWQKMTPTKPIWNLSCGWSQNFPLDFSHLGRSSVCSPLVIPLTMTASAAMSSAMPAAVAWEAGGRPL